MLRGLTAFIKHSEAPTVIKRLNHCISCGTKFQREKPGVPGFQKITRPERKPSVLATTEDLVNNLSSEQRNALGENNIPKNAETPRILVEEKIKRKWLKQSLHCRWCLDSRNGQSSPIEFPNAPHIPRDASLFHVSDALCFPFGLPAQHSPGTKYIVNRVDLIARHDSRVSKFKKYVMDEVFAKWRVPAADVFCVSSTRRWGLKKLAEKFGNGQNWLVGSTGAGKSALALSLAGESSLPDSCWPMPYKSQHAIYHKALPQYRSKVIVDTPSEVTNPEFYKSIRPEYLRKVVAGTPVFGKDPKYLKIKLKARPGQTVSIGGLLGLELPPSDKGSSIHFFVAIGGLTESNTRVFRNVERIDTINTSTDPNHRDWTLAKEPTPLKHLTDIELSRDRTIVVNGMGVIQPMPFGEFPSEYKIKVWAQPGIEVKLRTDVLPYIFPHM